MKIVVNKCYGGFGISNTALFALIRKNSDLVKSFTPKNYYGGENENCHKRSEWESEWNKDFPSRYDRFDDDWLVNRSYSLFYNEKEGLLYDLNNSHMYSIRNHPDLVEVVESLGEEASAPLAKLKVIEIPDDVDWEIDDYDGIETIHEKHRSW